MRSRAALLIKGLDGGGMALLCCLQQQDEEHERAATQKANSKSDKGVLRWQGSCLEGQQISWISQTHEELLHMSD